MASAIPVRVLLVEDELDVAAGIGDYLVAHGLWVDFAASAAEARARALESAFDLLVLDVNLPDRDGFALCRELKAELGLRQPVLFLTASGELEDKLLGFEAGAVDYIVKPFAPAELLARLLAIAAHVPAGGGAELRAAGYVLDLQRHQLCRGEQRLGLHAIGFAILRALVRAYPGSVGRAALCEAVWGDEAPASAPLRTHVYQLRRDLQARFGAPLIATVRGVGYCLELGDDEPA